MKLFHFYRVDDQSGISGTGPVVEGVEFTNGWCALRWITKMSSICFYKSLNEVKAIHGHGGKTEIIVHDFEPLQKPKRPAAMREFEMFLQIIEEAARVIEYSEERTAVQDIRRPIENIRRLLDDLEQSIGTKKQRTPKKSA